MIELPEAMSRGRFESYIAVAAHQADYVNGFGVEGCDLKGSKWWVAYNRQSLIEQADNDRLADYLLTCAKIAKQQGVTIPIEYILYDCGTSEHFGRPAISYLRASLIPNGLVAGIIIPQQGRLSCDPHNQLVFEKECFYYNIDVIYGDAPSGNDWSSETARLIQAKANQLRVQTNRKNALDGNKSRVLTGSVPAHKPPYGYILRPKRLNESGKASWEPNELDPDGQPLPFSTAWVVSEIFRLAADEEKTNFEIAKYLNELKIPAPGKPEWEPKAIGQGIRRKCYTGEAEFNSTERIHNPERALGDLTMGIKRTIIRPKPESERIPFQIPPLTTKERWNRANVALTKRGRGRGKQGKSIDALLRRRILCPRCNKPMSVMKRERNRIYYYCRANYNRFTSNRCNYNRFIPAMWDQEIWNDICVLLSDDAWIQHQLKQLNTQSEGIEKRIKSERKKIQQAERAIERVHDGWEREYYTSIEMEHSLSQHRRTIEKAESEIQRLQSIVKTKNLRPSDLQNVRERLEALRCLNLSNASFKERQDIVTKLGIKIKPTEDLSARTVQCRLNMHRFSGDTNTGCFTKVMSGTPGGIRTHDLSLRRAALYPAELQAHILENASYL